MTHTKLFRNGNSQAARIPADLAFTDRELDFGIERDGDELRIRPAARRVGDVLAKLRRFSPDYMSDGRGMHEVDNREAL